LHSVTNAYRDSDGKRNSDRDGNGYSYSKCHGDTDRNSVGNAAVYPDSKAASDARTASGQLLFR
jgi:hypothetical protein